ncbi:MAG: nuclear transport factor 2 family protein [Bacteroidota bacterium]
MTKLKARLTLTFCVILMNLIIASAQQTTESKQLRNDITQMDSLLFSAYNTQNLAAFTSMFTEDLEWFQDNGGLLTAKTVFATMEANFKQEHKLSRQLVTGSLEVHTIKNYGAIEIGSHTFRHMENGKEIVATFKFLMIWKKTDKGWKVSRVVSYDH